MEFKLPVPDLAAERAGNTDTPGVWHFDSGVPGRALMVSALVHGNELCGAWALKDLLASGLRPRRGSLTLAFCNLDAFDRFDHANHDASRFVQEDMNRVWSAERLDNPTTPDRQRGAALRPWVRRADWLLDLHSMHEPGAPLLLTGVLPRNIALARRLKAPQHVIVDAGHKDGVRMRDFEQFGDPARDDACALLIECGFHGDLSSRDVARDMVARMLVASGVADASDLPEGWLLADPASQRVLEVTDAVVAPSMNVRFAGPWSGLETFEKAGTTIGWADDQPVVTPYDHCTLIMPSLRQLKPGVTVVRLARDYAG
ncbi:succinylglutamate desuccinylase/aspartoacylase family protein [Achromobacter sp. MFA1 R4]|uniref:succinylglutamate desuccinylase/aspartoacylase domain-containing protein n=1 Tax=Achromobacter sp. MFA1 R4 TaxID=1881016 RepID=UPI00095377CD|nr:succinylglutamate desuccinylase/aspartoacylase family protein [Achromobacter sp. MFA1 R4]SIT22375.1 Succinylglutamate desuccinylase / Aspartoacylase family protein [Achromobacter sp. MFA1 R4]